MAKGLQQTIINENPALNTRADLVREHFDEKVWEKGVPVLVEMALMCPCKSKNATAQSSCKNCGGTGWAFINPRETRMVLQHMDAVQKYAGWSEELRGTVSITANADEALCYMDRITNLKGISRHQEVLIARQVNSTVFSYAAYGILKVEYIAKFVAATQKYVRLTEGTDYTFSGRSIIWLTLPKDTTITIRYTHHPTFHIIEMKRDTMETYRMTESGEKLQHMPDSIYARRAHYALDAENLAGDRLLDNSYVVDCPPGGDCGC